MIDLFKQILKAEEIKVYITLITGIVVFVLTSIYNHWRDRRAYVKLNDAHFRIKKVKRKIKNIPVKGRGDSEHTLLINDIFEKLEKLRKPELSINFTLIENTSQNGIFNIQIKHAFYNSMDEYVYEVYYQDYMRPKEVFYLANEGYVENLQYRNKFIKILYETSAGGKYLICERRFFTMPFRLKYKFLLGIIPILKSIKKISKSSFKKSRPLEINLVRDK